MIDDSKAGWLHNHGLSSLEALWEPFFKWFCKIAMFECNKEDYKRRQKGGKMEVLGGKKVKREADKQNAIVGYHRAAHFEFSLMIIYSVGLELFQRILDIPYFGEVSEIFDDCCGLCEAKQITKPGYYFLSYRKVQN